MYNIHRVALIALRHSAQAKVFFPLYGGICGEDEAVYACTNTPIKYQPVTKIFFCQLINKI